MLTDYGIEPTKRIGLVLGGGGVAGMAFHAGALWALHHDFGWDARDTDVIVGTSSGSIVGALLRAGVVSEDLAAWETDATSTRRATSSVPRCSAQIAWSPSHDSPNRRCLDGTHRARWANRPVFLRR